MGFHFYFSIVFKGGTINAPLYINFCAMRSYPYVRTYVASGLLLGVTTTTSMHVNALNDFFFGESPYHIYHAAKEYTYVITKITVILLTKLINS